MEGLLDWSLKGYRELREFLAALSKTELIKGAQKIGIDTGPTANSTIEKLKSAISKSIYPPPPAAALATRDEGRAAAAAASEASSSVV